MTKGEIRKYIKAQKQLLTADEKVKAAELAFAKLEDTDQFKSAQRILLYHSLPDEISTHAFIEKWSDKKTLFLPRVNGDFLDILRYREGMLHQGAFNIEEPDGDTLCNVDELELIVVPGVAFDSKCSRVGRGKGYYDRLLRDCLAPKIGIAYHFQIVDDIETEPHDIPVDMVITDQATYKR